MFGGKIYFSGFYCLQVVGVASWSRWKTAVSDWCLFIACFGICRNFNFLEFMNFDENVLIISVSSKFFLFLLSMLVP